MQEGLEALRTLEWKAIAVSAEVLAVASRAVVKPGPGPQPRLWNS